MRTTFASTFSLTLAFPLTLAFAMTLGCQGRLDPGAQLLDEQELNDDDMEPSADEQEVEAGSACALSARGCLDPRLGDNVISEAGPASKSPDDIRNGVIGDQTDVAQGEDPAVSPLMEATCADEFYGQGGMTEPGVELHLISINDAGPAGEVRVFVDRAEPVALVLSSYESVRWIVQASPSTRITEIVLNGHFDQSVEASNWIAVTELEGEQSLGSFGVGGGDDKSRQATALLIQGAEEATGLNLRSFSGCARGTSFSLGGL